MQTPNADRAPVVANKVSLEIESNATWTSLGAITLACSLSYGLVWLVGATVGWKSIIELPPFLYFAVWFYWAKPVFFEGIPGDVALSIILARFIVPLARRAFRSWFGKPLRVSKALPVWSAGRSLPTYLYLATPFYLMGFGIALAGAASSSRRGGAWFGLLSDATIICVLLLPVALAIRDMVLSIPIGVLSFEKHAAFLNRSLVSPVLRVDRWEAVQKSDTILLFSATKKLVVALSSQWGGEKLDARQLIDAANGIAAARCEALELVAPAREVAIASPPLECQLAGRRTGLIWSAAIVAIITTLQWSSWREVRHLKWATPEITPWQELLDLNLVIYVVGRAVFPAVVATVRLMFRAFEKQRPAPLKFSLQVPSFAFPLWAYVLLLACVAVARLVPGMVGSSFELPDSVVRLLEWAVSAAAAWDIILMLRRRGIEVHEHEVIVNRPIGGKVRVMAASASRDLLTLITEHEAMVFTVNEPGRWSRADAWPWASWINAIISGATTVPVPTPEGG